MLAIGLHPLTDPSRHIIARSIPQRRRGLPIFAPGTVVKALGVRAGV